MYTGSEEDQVVWAGEELHRAPSKSLDRSKWGVPRLGPHSGVPAGGCRNLLHARVRVHLQDQWQGWLSVKETCLTAIQLVNEELKHTQGFFCALTKEVVFQICLC